MLRIDTQHTNSLIPLANQTSSDNVKTASNASQGDTVNISDEGLELAKSTSRSEIISNTLDIENKQSNTQKSSSGNLRVDISEERELVAFLTLDEREAQTLAKQDNIVNQMNPNMWTEGRKQLVREATEEIDKITELIEKGLMTKEEGFIKVSESYDKFMNISFAGSKEEVVQDMKYSLSNSMAAYEERFGLSYEEDYRKYYSIHVHAETYGRDGIEAVRSAIVADAVPAS